MRHKDRKILHLDYGCGCRKLKKEEVKVHKSKMSGLITKGPLGFRALIVRINIKLSKKMRLTHISKHQQDSYLQNVSPVNPQSILQSIKQLYRHPGNTRFAMELCRQNWIAIYLSLNRQ